MNTGWFSMHSDQPLHSARIPSIAGYVAFAVLLTTNICAAQVASAPLPKPETQIAAPAGYSSHRTLDVGGRIANTVGSGAMYDTLVNLKSGPRVLGETFE